jgi:hypothetical protein
MPTAVRKKTNPGRALVRIVFAGAGSRGRAGACLLAAALLPAMQASAGAQQQATRVDGLEALVGGLEAGPGVDVILRSDVELYALIDLGGETAGPRPEGPPPEPLMRKALQQLVGEHVIAREAERLRVSEPRASDLERERRRLELEAGGRERLTALLRELAVGKRELESILLRRARVTAFLKANLEAPRTAAGPLPEAAPAGAGKGGPGGARSRDASLEKAAERWIRTLMARTPVRMFGEYAP